MMLSSVVCYSMARHARVEPFRRSGPVYECVRCCRRLPAGKRVARCPGCGAPVRNIATPQE